MYVSIKLFSWSEVQLSAYFMGLSRYSLVLRCFFSVLFLETLRWRTPKRTKDIVWVDLWRRVMCSSTNYNKHGIGRQRFLSFLNKPETLDNLFLLLIFLFFHFCFLCICSNHLFCFFAIRSGVLTTKCAFKICYQKV